jgi:hypothetical protein
MSCLRPTPRLHHAPTPTSVARLHGRPKEDLGGASRMSCTRRRRGAPWPPATGLEEPPVSRRGRASGSRARRPTVDPILSVQALHKAFSSLVLAVEKGKWEGRTPAAGGAPLNTGRRGTRRTCSVRWPPPPRPPHAQRRQALGAAALAVRSEGEGVKCVRVSPPHSLDLYAT